MSLQEKIQAAKTIDLFADLPEKDQIEATVCGKFAAALLNYRWDHKITQTQLAEQLGVSQSQISKWENGEDTIPLQKASQVLAKLDMEIDVRPTQWKATIRSESSGIQYNESRPQEFKCVASGTLETGKMVVYSRKGAVFA